MHLAALAALAALAGAATVSAATVRRNEVGPPTVTKVTSVWGPGEYDNKHGTGNARHECNYIMANKVMFGLDNLHVTSFEYVHKPFGSWSPSADMADSEGQIDFTRVSDKTFDWSVAEDIEGVTVYAVLIKSGAKGTFVYGYAEGTTAGQVQCNPEDNPQVPGGAGKGCIPLPQGISHVTFCGAGVPTVKPPVPTCEHVHPNCDINLRPGVCAVETGTCIDYKNCKESATEECAHYNFCQASAAAAAADLTGETLLDPRCVAITESEGDNVYCYYEAIADTDDYTPEPCSCNQELAACEAPPVCVTSNVECPVRGEQIKDNRVCRPRAGLCDFEEFCDGTNGLDCPEDAVAPATTVCRRSTNLCDPEETCTGTTADCPVEVKLDVGDVCRPKAGVCDVEETCQIINNVIDCPAEDTKSTDVCASTTVTIGQVGVSPDAYKHCFPISCDGESNDCPAAPEVGVIVTPSNGECADDTNQCPLGDAE